jgi:hypothetical protein
MTKERILSEIKRTAAANGGVPLGIDRFREATGIRKEDWYGVFWVRWSDAQVEAGFDRNQFGAPAFDDEWVVGRIATYIRELGHFPVKAELKMRKLHVREFPNIVTIRRRLGAKAEIVNKILEYCRANDGWDDVIAICMTLQVALPAHTQSASTTGDSPPEVGHVYLLKHGKAYKIGRSTEVSRRYKEIRTQMPYKTEEIHVIETDDPAGIEAYWHNRFMDKRLEGEWFELSAADVKAFKKRRFM